MVSLMVLVVATLVAMVLAAPEEMYPTKFDNINVDDILKNDRLMTKAFDCLMDKGSCPPDILELKKHLPDALKSGCSKCSEKQKAGAQKVLHHLIQHKKPYYDQLEKKYDPEGVYQARYKELAAKQGIKI